MQLKVLLNSVARYKSFVYGQQKLVESGGAKWIEVILHARKNSAPICSGCSKPGPHYDTQKPRRFDFPPIWTICVVFIYAMRRVNCPRCGVKIEQVPWAEGKSPLTREMLWFLAEWAKLLSWQEVARRFRTSWYHVYSSVEHAVDWGRAHMNLDGLTAIGVDEIQWRSGHKYLTLVYQINAGCKRLLWVGRERTEATLESFFDWLGQERSDSICFVCSDMWKPYLKVIAHRAKKALHVLDRFHIMSHMGKAIDKVRSEEARQMKRLGLEVLKRTRWLLLKRPENLSDNQRGRLQQLLKLNLRSVRSYLLKEDFQHFWDYVSPTWAGKFLDQWCRRTMRSRIEPMKDVARMLRSHRELLLNYFKARKQFSSGVVEGLNNKAKLTTRKSYGFSEFKTVQLALYHSLGDLPSPDLAHRFF